MQLNGELLQFIKFGLVGFSNNVVFYAVNAGVLLALRCANVSWDFVAGNIAGFLVSVLWSFFLNRRFVFVQESGRSLPFWRTLFKTYVSYGFTGIILNNVLGALWIGVFGVSKFLAPILNLFISVPINFVLNKFWAFKGEKRQEEE